nr:hypothetical protein [Tanacetum cinerariifolium]
MGTSSGLKTGASYNVESRTESSLSLNFILSSGTITSIWIGSRCVETMTSYTSSRKETSKGSAFKTLKTCYCFWHVEDLQLGVESYQKKLNITRPDTYHFDLKRKESYTAYSNPRGFIYQNKDKQNRLIRINELHKFSDGRLNDVRTALDDRLKAKDKKDHEKFEEVTPTKPGRMPKPYLSHRFIANCFNAGHLKMEVKDDDARNDVKGMTPWQSPAIPLVERSCKAINDQMM